MEICLPCRENRPLSQPDGFSGLANVGHAQGVRTARIPLYYAARGAANAWGLRDMFGSMFEWCLDSCSTPHGVSVTAPEHIFIMGKYVPVNGSFSGNYQSVVFHGEGYPDENFGGVGFRVVLNQVKSQERLQEPNG